MLPYLVGERFPVMDKDIKGCIIGVTPETTNNDIVRACLEGVAFSIRQGIEQIGRAPQSVSIIGGGAMEVLWCQTISDVLKQKVIAYENSKFLPSDAISSAVLVGEGIWSNYPELNEHLIKHVKYTIYESNAENFDIYDKTYIKYKKVYPAVKNLFE